MKSWLIPVKGNTSNHFCSGAAPGCLLSLGAKFLATAARALKKSLGGGGGGEDSDLFFSSDFKKISKKLS